MYLKINYLYKFIKQNGKSNEFTGVYYKDKGFYLSGTESETDGKDGREFIKINLNPDSGIVWHSHPQIDLTSFPSLEDLDVVRMNYNIIHIIVTKLGVYIIKAISNKITINDLIKYYFNFQENKCTRWEYKLLEKNFTSSNIIANKTLFLCFIKKDKVNDDIINKMIDFCKKVSDKFNNN